MGLPFGTHLEYFGVLVGRLGLLGFPIGINLGIELGSKTFGPGTLFQRVSGTRFPGHLILRDPLKFNEFNSPGGPKRQLNLLNSFNLRPGHLILRDPLKFIEFNGPGPHGAQGPGLAGPLN